MKAVTYKSLRDGVLRRMGLDAAQPVMDSQASALADYLAEAVDVAWSFYVWPDVTLTEQRTPAIHTLTLEEAAPANPIGRILHIYDEHPGSDSSYAKELDFTQGDTTAEITDDSHADSVPVWVRFRLPAPQFTSEAYNAATTYAPGDLVYHAPTSDCYLCLAATTGNAPTSTAYWRRQQVPAYLADHARTYAHAMTLEEDGQYDKAAYQRARAEGQLVARMDEFWLQASKVHHFSARFQ